MSIKLWVGVAAAWVGVAATAAPSVYEQREQDWRNGAVVYQVWVDRFAPAANLEAKRHLYPAPKRLRAWHELPTKGEFLPQAKVWSHEIDFWGGDIASLRGKLGYVQGLGVDVLYLNPIHLAYTNHKYDALDYQAVSPEYGTRADVKALAADLHGRGMKLVLDGVFNHMGRNSPKFQSALAGSVGGGRHRSETRENRASLGSADKPRVAPWAQEVMPGEAGLSRVAADAPSAGHAPAPRSPYRDWFYIGPQFEKTAQARVWWGAINLPELNLENPAVRQHVFAARDSVIRSYLRDGVDGWRLDTAFEFGTTMLGQMTQAAHAEKPGSLLVGEIVNYPAGWLTPQGKQPPAADAVMNFTLRRMLLDVVERKLKPATAQRMIARMVADSGIAPLLKSWTLLDNHDLPRVASRLPNERQRRLAQVLQFTLPGSPNLWQGSEIDTLGDGDPEQRAPMRWDVVEAGHPALTFTRQLIALRKAHRALRVGDWRPIEADQLLAFERHTDRAMDTVLVLANPSEQDVTETVMIANSALMNATGLQDLLGPQPAERPSLDAGLLRLTVPAGSVRVLRPVFEPVSGYTPYKRTP